MIGIKSILKDERIHAYNAMVEITIKEYLEFAHDIIDNNEFQRKKVIKSKIKEILKEDLRRNCLVPPIVLAVTNEKISEIKDINDIGTSTIVLNDAISSREILIIDGLQRTYVMLSLEEDLIKIKDDEGLLKFYSHKIRAEIYLGINRIGLLYRMITLNTGQTTMSTRHLMEILYIDYSKIGLDGIKLIKDKDETQVALNTVEFNFKSILDGFNSYVEKNESIIERTEILDNIKSLEIIKDEVNDKDLFKEFVLCYKAFLDSINNLSDSWHYVVSDNEESALKLNSSPFGKTTLDIFKKSQAITGFGAALGYLKEVKKIEFEEICTKFPKITFSNNDPNLSFLYLLKHFDSIKEKSKKIGNDQRFFFKMFFRALLNPDSDQYLTFDKSSDFAYNITREEKF